MSQNQEEGRRADGGDDNPMFREPVWRLHRWQGKTDAEWIEMSQRLLSPPESNRAFWDWAEQDVLQSYATRAKQVEEHYTDHPYFSQNLRDVHAALEFAECVIHAEWQKDPRAGDDIGIKEAIRTGRAFRTDHSFLSDGDEAAAMLKTMKKVKKELTAVMSLDEDPSLVSREQWEKMAARNPGPLLKAALKRCEHEVGGESSSESGADSSEQGKESA